MLFLLPGNWHKAFHNAEWNASPPHLHFSLAFHPIFARVQAKIGGPSSSLPLLPQILLHAELTGSAYPALSGVIPEFLGHALYPRAGILPLPKDGFWHSFISGVAIQCTQTVPLWYICVILKQLFTNYLQSGFKMWQRLGYGWTGNYKCNCVWHVTLCHLLWSAQTHE